MTSFAALLDQYLVERRRCGADLASSGLISLASVRRLRGC